MNVRVLAVLLCVLLAAGCAKVPRAITLASGQHFNVLIEASQSIKDVDGAQRLVFSVMYVTPQNMNDVEALRSEVAQIFEYYRPRIEKEGFSRVNITPAKVDDAGGGVQSHPFYLEQQSTGEWVIQ